MWDFIAVGNLHVDFGLLFDPLSGVFVLLSASLDLHVLRQFEWRFGLFLVVLLFAPG